LFKGSWGASPSPLVSDHDAGAGAGAGEGLALPKRYVCFLDSSEDFWVGSELRDYILGDPSWVYEVCVPLELENRRVKIDKGSFEDAMREARAVILSKSWRFLAIVDIAGVKAHRVDRPSRVLRRLYTFYSYVEALRELIGDSARNLKKKNRRDGWAYLGVITFTVSRDFDQFEAGRVLSRSVTEFWSRFRRRYGDVEYLCAMELQSDGYPHYHCVFYSERPLPVFKHRGMWRFRDKREWEGWYRCGFIDAFALKKLRHAVDYLKKYLSKQFPSGSRESQDHSQDDLGWKGWEVEYSYITYRRILRASRRIETLARKLRETRLIRRSDIIEEKKLPMASVGGVYIKIDSRALILARVFRNYVLASERHREARGIEVWIEHPSIRLYHDLINIIPNLDIGDPLRIRLYLVDLKRGLDPPVDLWVVLFQIWVIDSFTG